MFPFQMSGPNFSRETAPFSSPCCCWPSAAFSPQLPLFPPPPIPMSSLKPLPEEHSARDMLEHPKSQSMPPVSLPVPAGHCPCIGWSTLGFITWQHCKSTSSLLPHFQSGPFSDAGCPGAGYQGEESSPHWSKLGSSTGGGETSFRHLQIAKVSKGDTDDDGREGFLPRCSQGNVKD